MNKTNAPEGHKTPASAGQEHSGSRHIDYEVTPAADALVRMYTGRLNHHSRPPVTRENFMKHLQTVTLHKMLVTFTEGRIRCIIKLKTFYGTVNHRRSFTMATGQPF